MNIHLHRNDILQLIYKKFNIEYDLIKDNNNVVVDVVSRNRDALITWESSNIEVENPSK